MMCKTGGEKEVTCPQRQSAGGKSGTCGHKATLPGSSDTSGIASPGGYATHRDGYE